MKFALALAALQAATVVADCPNACSTHGICSSKDQCNCDPNWMGNDCSQRVCQFELSWVDTPRGDLSHNGQFDYAPTAPVSVQWSNVAEYEVFPSMYDEANMDPVTAAAGEAHFYSECSGKGSCDRASGECVCYAGYTGSACQRTACANDCSGQGVCRTLREVAALSLNKFQYAGLGGQKLMAGVQSNFDYNRWDADKAQTCLCDPGFSGADCSLRSCPRNDDPLASGQRWCGGAPCGWEVQSLTLSDSGPTTYSVSYTDSFNATYAVFVTLDVAAMANGFVAPAAQALTAPGPTTTAGVLQAALRALPTGALQRVEVYPEGNATATPGADSTRTFAVTFVGVSGDQELLAVEPYNGAGMLWYNPDSPVYNPTFHVEAARAVVEVQVGTYEEIECSGRGLCDYTAGVCGCFSGYTGEACQLQNALPMGAHA